MKLKETGMMQREMGMEPKESWRQGTDPGLPQHSYTKAASNLMGSEHG
ncbi:MAG: hypothetical protein ACPHL6_12680 [Rubripirellula sp.]